MDTPLPTVLLIEDSPTQAKEIAAHMSAYDINVLVADDGPPGLRLAKFQRVDLIVLDINLPSMDGFQVCRRLKRDEDTAAIPVIMLTSADNADDMLQGLQVGADDYILKDDFAVDSLLIALRSRGLIPPEDA